MFYLIFLGAYLMDWVASVSGSVICAVPSIIALIYFEMESQCSD